MCFPSINSSKFGYEAAAKYFAKKINLSTLLYFVSLFSNKSQYIYIYIYIRQAQYFSDLAVICEENHKVASHNCVACPSGKSNPRNDDALGEDTFCEGEKKNFFHALFIPSLCSHFFPQGFPIC